MTSKKKSSTKKKPKRARKEAAAPASIQEAAETRTAVASNVAWMLSLMSTLAAEAIGLVCRWYTSFVEPVELLTIFSGVMLFVAGISGLLTLLMIPVVFHFNKVRPPRFIVQVAVLAGGLPLIVIAAQILRFS